MTKEEIIQMAKPFLWGGNVVEGWTFNSYEQLECFAKLVADHEREACAKVCDGYSDGRHANMADLCAEAIRARGKHD